MQERQETETLEERDPWDQMEGEMPQWFYHFTQFRLIGPSRNLKRYYRKQRMERSGGEISPQAYTPDTWIAQSRRFHWKTRAEAWDTALREAQEDEAEETLGSGLALAHNRIHMLQALAERLEVIIFSDKRAPSPYMVEQYRGVLDDIAKEKGERGKEIHLSGAKGAPLQILTSWGRGGSATDVWENKQLAAPRTVVEEVKPVSQTPFVPLFGSATEAPWDDGHSRLDKGER